MYELIFGWIATVMSVVYKVPQMYTFYKEKSSKGVSIMSLEIQTINYILYSLHGYMIKDPPLFLVSVISVGVNIILCCQYFYYKKNVEIVAV